jgi:hypothetical protein
VHWLKAKARFNRWDEEFMLIPNEMDWTVRYFQHQAEKWGERADSAKEKSLRGHSAYALKQKWIWEQFASRAKDAFDNVAEAIL